jgi:hypothetical protein
MEILDLKIANIPVGFSAWVARYLQFATIGVRVGDAAQKMASHLSRSQIFFVRVYWHCRISPSVCWNVVIWQQQPQSASITTSTVNNHLALLSVFTTRVYTHSPSSFQQDARRKG